MLGDPAHDPINQVASVEVKEAADEVVAPQPEVKVETAEVAMIIPPDSVNVPLALSNTMTSTDVARLESDKLRVEAGGLRVAYTTSARSEVQGAEWQKATEEAVRKLNAALPGTYEFRVVREGVKTRVLKFKCGDCPSSAPRAPQQPRRLPAAPPAPVTFTSAEWAGE
jgi:hypothetical protein